MSKICYKCNRLNDDQAPNCISCGAQFDNSVNSPEPDYVEPGSTVRRLDPNIYVSRSGQQYDRVDPSQQPMYSQPNQPSYQQPEQPVYQQPQQPVYQQPEQPVYQQPEQPVYQQPQQPVYQQPEQPVYQQPEQPVYQQPEQPVYQQPEQPVYQQPEQPVYQQPEQPVYQQPEQPVYQQPEQPVYQQPEQPVYHQPEQPEQPVYQQPEQPVYQQPEQPEQPVYQPVEQQPEAPFEQPVEQQPEAPFEQQPEAPFEQPVEQQPEAPFEQPVEQQPEAPFEQPAEPQPEDPFDQPVEPQPEAPFEQPVEQQPEAPFEQPAEQQPEAPFEQPAEQQPEAPYEQPVYQQPGEPVAPNQGLANGDTITYKPEPTISLEDLVNEPIREPNTFNPNKEEKPGEIPPYQQPYGQGAYNQQYSQYQDGGQGVYQQPQYGYEPSRPKKSGKKGLIIGISALVVIALVVGGIFAVKAFSKKSIDITKSVSLSELNLSGTDGSASASVDVTKMSEKLGGRYNDPKVKDFILSGVTYKISPSSSLKNGDVITITATYSPDKAANAGVKVSSDPAKITISGLTNSQFVGKWKNVAYTLNGVRYEWTSTMQEVILTFDTNGIASLTTAGSSDGSGKWVESGTNITITDAYDGTKIIGKLQDGLLYLDVGDGMVFIMKRL